MITRIHAPLIAAVSRLLSVHAKVAILLILFPLPRSLRHALRPAVWAAHSNMAEAKG